LVRALTGILIWAIPYLQYGKAHPLFPFVNGPSFHRKEAHTKLACGHFFTLWASLPTVRKGPVKKPLRGKPVRNGGKGTTEGKPKPITHSPEKERRHLRAIFIMLFLSLVFTILYIYKSNFLKKLAYGFPFGGLGALWPFLIWAISYLRYVLVFLP
jgi:hypothetical protein